MKLTPVILAAGRSERMGAPKPYLQINGKTFLEVIAERIRRAGIESKGFIVYNRDHLLFLEKLHLPGFDLIQNARQELKQLYSLHLALEKVPSVSSGIMMCLADHPLVREETYRLIGEAHLSHLGKIVLPTWKGKRGHPTIFPRKFFEEIKGLSVEKPGGAKNILSAHPGAVLELPVNDPGILADMDTTEDLIKAGIISSL